MKNMWNWLDENFEMVCGVFLMSVMTLVIFVQVIMRYIFHNSLSWSEEFARYCFIWLIYLSASYGCKRMAHIKIDAALKLYPKKVRPYITILGDLLVLVLAVYLLMTGIQLVDFQITYQKVSPAMGFPMAVVDMAPVVGFGLIIIRQIQAVFKRVSALDERKEDR